MLFSSLPFLYYFLPVVMIAYFLVPGRFKNGVLLLSSLFFYGWGEPKYLLLMLFSIGVFYGCGLAIEKGKRKKAWLAVSVAVGVAQLAIFKYADFFLSTVNGLTGLGIPMLRLALPIGISFYTFQCISYTVDVYRGNVAAQKNIVDFGTYVALFPQLIAGPIVRYADIAAELPRRQTGKGDFAYGMRRFLVGLGKKILIANQLGELTEIFRASGEKSLLFYWMYAVAFTLHIYFDFSGYSDMAIGLGRIFGFHFPENFNYPYLSRSVTEFWRRWHMSLGGWFRDYVYIPLGGNRVSRIKWVRNILAVWLLTGLWHGASWNFVLWGGSFALFLMAEKWLPKLKNLPGVLGNLYVMTVIVLSFVLFNGDSLTQVGQDFAGLFGGLGLPVVTAESLYYLKSYAAIFLMAIIGATPLPAKLTRRISEQYSAGLELVFMAAILLLCTAYLVDGSFNPFLYFRF